LCQNGCLSVLSSIRETEKSRVGWGRQSCCYWSNPWWKVRSETVRCRDPTANFL
jgi:hypothetical protein